MGGQGGQLLRCRCVGACGYMRVRGCVVHVVYVCVLISTSHQPSKICFVIDRMCVSSAPGSDGQGRVSR